MYIAGSARTRARTPRKLMPATRLCSCSFALHGSGGKQTRSPQPAFNSPSAGMLMQAQHSGAAQFHACACLLRGPATFYASCPACNGLCAPAQAVRRDDMGLASGVLLQAPELLASKWLARCAKGRLLISLHSYKTK